MHTPEAGTNRLTPCPTCGRQLVFVAGSKLPANVGNSDFDCFMVVEEQGAAVRTYLLGGTADIAIGDSPDCLIRLTDDLGDGKLGILRRAPGQPSRWQIIPIRIDQAILRSELLYRNELAHGDTVSWPRVRMRYYTHPIPEDSAAQSTTFAMPTIPTGPAVLAGTAFLLVIGSAVIRNVMPIPSRDVRMLLTLVLLFILAPSLWIAALVWGLTRLKTFYAWLIWIGILLCLALIAIAVRVSMGIL